MTTREYSDALATVEALAGANLATQEEARIKYFLNQRARKAYDETPFWPRFLTVGEERQISSTGIMPFSEAGLDTIGTLISFHAKQPYGSTAANEYVQWTMTSGGYLISGYQATTYSDGDSFTISGTTVPDVAATVFRTNPDDSLAYYSNVSDPLTSTLDHVDLFDGPTNWFIAYDQAGSGVVAIWISSDHPASPADVTTWQALTGAAGTPTVAAATVYGIFATYQVEFDTTYGLGTGESTTIPEEWFDYMIQGAFADWLTSEGQMEKAVVAEQMAEMTLVKQLDKVSRQVGDIVNTRIATHNNTQYRS